MVENSYGEEIYRGDRSIQALVKARDAAREGDEVRLYTEFEPNKVKRYWVHFNIEKLHEHEGCKPYISMGIDEIEENPEYIDNNWGYDKAHIYGASRYSYDDAFSYALAKARELDTSGILNK